MTGFSPLIEMRYTHIQLVFDRCVQHSEVCEEDAEVGHGALGVGLCKKKQKKACFISPPGDFYSHCKRAHTARDFREAACSYFSNDGSGFSTSHTHRDDSSLFHFAATCWSIPRTTLHQTTEHHPLSRSDISINVWM